ncbi:LOW QUALITY PROTEIN: cytotoxic and regulatory T-cell molecule [Myiozetetes cayanensis]|uniref:LOW QUALITY PROTEIN: cytotoxic and regulatory T-cell molecule n=1 Tax=Myiozetetes cayanensis TaxID=478635 RepID=UPI00215E671A|nr:LOW QUALITY PROTEIN: cytotoxic and regulatory T-cell molecule [Myiozetetes cayanensis]
MSVPRVLHAVALLLLQGGFPGAASVTLKEGEDLNLRCTFSTLSSTNSSALQWLNPRGFTIFLNGQQVLRDKRYKLIRYSKGELSIQLSQVTVHDEGSYKCFYYGSPFQSKAQPVEVLAAPSNPALEASQDTERGITLSCHTQGCKPQPRVSWLLDNGMELPGDTKHKLGADGKKWSTTSTLTVLSHGPNATASCIIHHPALREERLMASFHFQDLPRTGSNQPTSPPAAPEAPAGTSSAPTQQNLPADVTSDWLEGSSASSGDEELGGSSGYGDPNGTEAAPKGNVTTEELPRTEAPLPRENATVISIFTLGQDPKSKGVIKKEKNLLLPVLVAALIFVLLIIVLLFMMKLKKAHGVWKRENDVSEQTLESYKSRSNEDSPGHEKNGQVANHKPNLQYVTEGYGETTPKNPSDKTTAISEKMFACGKETDV